jgi:pimeloyl-ACP methyl ester carboxylesterase
MPYCNIADNIELYYDEYGSGEKIVLSSEVSFPPNGVQQALAQYGYHVFCITLRGFGKSTHVFEDYGEKWFDTFADDTVAFAKKMGFQRFIYMGASHGAGVGWHILLRHPEMVSAFVAVVPGPHNIEQGSRSIRSMGSDGRLAMPKMDPDTDDPARNDRRSQRRALPRAEQSPEERAVDYRRPLIALGTEEKLMEALKTITTPTVIIGGLEDWISTPELMLRSAKSLPNCKLIIYSNCGHNVDLDITEEVTAQALLFLRAVEESGRQYLPLKEVKIG